MTDVGTFEAKTHFTRLLKRVARGERITITRHGTPVARIVPIDGVDRQAARQAIGALRALRKGQKLGGLSVRKLIAEGRR